MSHFKPILKIRHSRLFLILIGLFFIAGPASVFSQGIISPDKNGVITVEIKELQRIEVHLTPKNASSRQWTGSMVVGDCLKPLPIGSSFDAERGIFYWSPGPGFLGTYELAFMTNKGQYKAMKTTVNIKIVPRF